MYYCAMCPKMTLTVIFILVSVSITNGKSVNASQCPAVDAVKPVYIPDNDCTKFWECSNGTPYQFDCPDGLHFNPTLNICDWPEQAGCTNNDNNSDSSDEESESNSSQEESDSNSSQEESSQEISDEDDNGKNEDCASFNAYCPAVDGEYPVYIPLPNCTQFCQCSNGKPYLHDCPDSLHFNPVLNVCDWPDIAGCSGGNNTDGAGTTTTEGNNDDDSNITTTEGNNDNDNNSTTTEGNNDDDDNNITTTESSNDNDVTSTTESNNNGGDNDNQVCLEVDTDCPAVDGEYPVYIPLPNCTQFCQCSNGKPHLHDCPDGLHFNPVLNVCDWPDNAQCENKEPA